MAHNTAHDDRTPLLGSHHNPTHGTTGPPIASPNILNTSPSAPQGPTFSHAIFPVYNDTFSPEAIRRADSRARRRFATALFLGFLVWVLCGTFVGLAGGQGWWGEAGGGGGNRRNGAGKWPGALDPVPASDGNVTSCTDFLASLPTSAIIIPPIQVGPVTQQHQQQQQDSEPLRGGAAVGIQGSSDLSHYTTLYKSKSYFHFELDERDGLFLLGRGRFSVGPVKYVLEEPKSKSYVASASNRPVVEVEVAAVWNDKELLKSTKVCSLKKTRCDGNGNEQVSTTKGSKGIDWGVGIYSPHPDYPDQYRRLSFETVVRLPTSALPYLDNLRLEGPSFAPIDITLSPVRFGRVDFSTTNGAISVAEKHHLGAEEINLTTSNGHVQGTFNVTSRLHLNSQNGRIDADVNLVKGTAAEKKEGVRITDVEVSAITSNGGVRLRYLQHPYGIVLNSQAHTSNGNAEVQHQPAFEGSFSLQTSWGHGSVVSNDHAKDPSGKNRKRYLRTTKDERTIGIVNQEGTIVWQPVETEMQGSTDVKTSLGTALLKFV